MRELHLLVMIAELYFRIVPEDQHRDALKQISLLTSLQITDIAVLKESLMQKIIDISILAVPCKRIYHILTD